jgi:predicted O-methyltransferase YrrM
MKLRWILLRLFTPLCHLATKYMTDKSPYNLMTHRHPYTAVYDTFLRPFQRTQNLKLGEIGILNGSSTKMWREYFPVAKLCCFDIEMNYLKNVEGMTGVETYLVDAGQSSGLRNSLLEATHDGKKFDILLEDASHRLEHQLLFLRDALEYVAPGGLLIIEDIFRAIPAARFQEAIDSVSHMVQNVVLVRTEHVYRYSPDWENDRILFVWKA